MFEVENADRKIKTYIDKLMQGQYYRLIDPETKMVYDYQNGALIKTGRRCYEIWGRETPCGNCISKRALWEKRMGVKIEMAGSEMYLACAYPVVLENRDLSMELAWNITQSIAMEGDSPIQNVVISDLVSRFNLAIIQDSYTGIYNKRFSEETLEEAVRVWTPEKALSVILMDIDYFKKVNDTYGHVQGDDVIKAIAAILKNCAKEKEGYACRYGGDEFLLILPGYSKEKGEELLVQLKSDIAGNLFGEKQPFHVSVSGGVSEYAPRMNHWREMLDEADQNMYVEKSHLRQHQPEGDIYK